MNLAQLSDNYLKTIPNPKTRHTYSGRLAALFSFFNCHKICQINQLTAEVLGAYQEQLKEKELSANSQYVYLEQAKKFLGYLYQNNYCFIDLSEAICLPKWQRSKKQALSTAQIEKRLKAVNEPEPFGARARAILALKLYETLCSGEISELTLLDLDLPRSELRLKRRKQLQQLKEKTVIYLKQYLKVRQYFKPKTDYLFLQKNGTPINQQSITVILRCSK